jgi:hypothetical protein
VQEDFNMADAGPEARRRQALVSDAAVKKKTEAALNSTRQKTDRLKALRLEKEAAADRAEIDETRAPKGNKPKRATDNAS